MLVQMHMKAAVCEQVLGLSCRSQKCRKRNRYNRTLVSYCFIPHYIFFNSLADTLSSTLFSMLRVCTQTFLSWGQLRS